MLISDPALIFTVLISVMLLAPLLSEKLRIPDLVLLLLAGIIIGPFGTGILARSSAITLFGEVGLLYIMFQAGLEIDLHNFNRTRNRTVGFGLLTFIIPQGLGALLGVYLLGMDWPAAILMASMFASHTLLSYPLASRLGISKMEPVAVCVGATIITNTLALLVLAVVADSARGSSLTGVWFWTGISAGMTALTALALWVIPAIGRWFFLHVPEKGGAQFLFVLATMSGCAYLSYYAKMEPIIGAFLAGVAFNRLIPPQSALMNRVDFVGNTLFVPFFLLSVGMMVDPVQLIKNPRSWFVALMMVVGVIVTKWLAAQLTRVLYGYQRDEANVVFGLSVVQAAATLAAVLVGYNLRIFDESVLNGAIAMILVTCSLGSWAVDRYGRQMAARAPLKAPRGRTEQRLLVPVANPAYAARLLDLSFLLRDTGIPGGIHPVTIVRDEGETADNVARGEKLLAHCLSHAASADIPVTPGVRVGMNISDGIIRAAKELRASMLLLGWAGEKSTVHRVFATLLEHLLEECPSRILLCRLMRPLNTTKRLFLPLPPLARHRWDLLQLLHDAKWLTRQIGAELHVNISQPSEEKELRELIAAARPAVPTTIEVNADWREERTQLFTEIRPDDMVLLPTERRHSALWSPNLERLPQALAERFPQINILLSYPALLAEEGEMPLELPEVLPTESIELLPVAAPAGTPALEEVINSLARQVEQDACDGEDSVYAQLLNSARSYPVEMAAGLAMIHAHSDAVARPTVLILCAKNGWTLPGCAAEVTIILAEISPRTHSQKLHLKTLADLARCFNNPEIATQATGIDDPVELARVVRYGLQVVESTAGKKTVSYSGAGIPGELDGGIN